MAAFWTSILEGRREPFLSFITSLPESGMKAALTALSNSAMTKQGFGTLLATRDPRLQKPFCLILCSRGGSGRHHIHVLPASG